MRDIAPKSPPVQPDLDIDALLDLLVPSRDLLADLAGLNFHALFENVKPQTSRRESFNQRYLARCLRAARAAGFEVREITPEGHLILGSPVLAVPEDDNIILAKLQ